MADPHILTFESYVARLNRIIGPVVPVDAGEETTVSDDLGIESIRVYELVIVTENLASCDVPPDELPILFTLGDLYQYYLGCVQLTCKDL